jgi:hypothetical protein
MRGERALGGGRAAVLLLALLVLGACGLAPEDPDVAPQEEIDAAAPADARIVPDGAQADRRPPPDGYTPDVSPSDVAGADTAAPDAAADSAPDGAARPDAERSDAAAPDARHADAKPRADGSSAPPSSIERLSDDFCCTDSLDPSWALLNASKFNVAVHDGALHLLPTQASLWFNGIGGALVWKEVTGNFKVTATVRPRKRTDPGEPPSDKIHLGGLMARSSIGSHENYVFIVVGVDTNDHSVETKTTVDDSSTYVGPSWPYHDAELRICRQSSEFRLYKRAPGASAWLLAAVYVRADLPAALQVGPAAYAGSALPNLDVGFDAVHFEPVTSVADCTLD